MSDIKKIELALSDLTTALAEHAEKHAADIGSERIESWHNLFKNIAQRVEKLEGHGSAVDELHAAHRRIADLEVRIEDLEKELEAAANDFGHHMKNEITAAHRRLDELTRHHHRRTAELEKRVDDLENDFQLDNVRTIVADMINDGDIRLHID